MSIWLGNTKLSGEGGSNTSSGEYKNHSFIRDTEQFSKNQTILSWATMVMANTEKSIYENIPPDAPTDTFTGVISVKILSPEEKIREVIAYGTSGNDIYYRIAITGATSTWLSPWKDIVNDSDKVSGYTANEIYNKTKSIVEYIPSIGSDDIRYLIAQQRVPSGEYIIDSEMKGMGSSGLPVIKGILHLTVSSMTNIDGKYYASIMITTETAVPEVYTCTIYNGSQYTSWLNVGSGTSSGPVDTLGVIARIPIKSTDDLNRYIEDGAYCVETDKIMKTLYHRPSDTCGYLNVRHATSSIVIQEFVTTDFRIWSRSYNTVDKSWNQWIYVYNSSDNLSTTATNGVHIGSTAPTTTTMLWVDTAHSAALKYYNNTTKQWEACSMAWA